MQFNSNVVTEIVVPSNVPFLPGNNVLGIGTQVPPELVAENILAAMIFYNDEYSPTSTLPRVVYTFIGQTVTPDPDYSVGIYIGFTWQANPSANSPLIVVGTLTVGAAAPTAPPYTILESITNMQNHNGNYIMTLGEDATADGNPVFGILNNAGTHAAEQSVTNAGVPTPTNPKGWTTV
jgi:hypothetical protein